MRKDKASKERKDEEGNAPTDTNVDQGERFAAVQKGFSSDGTRQSPTLVQLRSPESAASSPENLEVITSNTKKGMKKSLSSRLGPADPTVQQQLSEKEIHEEMMRQQERQRIAIEEKEIKKLNKAMKKREKLERKLKKRGTLKSRKNNNRGDLSDQSLAQTQESAEIEINARESEVLGNVVGQNDCFVEMSNQGSKMSDQLRAADTTGETTIEEGNQLMERDVVEGDENIVEESVAPLVTAQKESGDDRAEQEFEDLAADEKEKRIIDESLMLQDKHNQSSCISEEDKHSHEGGNKQGTGEIEDLLQVANLGLEEGIDLHRDGTNGDDVIVDERESGNLENGVDLDGVGDLSDSDGREEDASEKAKPLEWLYTRREVEKGTVQIVYRWA